MKYSVSVKNGSLGITGESLLKKYITHLHTKLQNGKNELSELTLHLKRHEKHHFYSAVFTLHLPHKSLIAHVGEHSLEKILATGFKKLEKEIETYKGKHYTIRNQHAGPGI